MSHMNGDLGFKGDSLFQRLFILLFAILFLLMLLDIGVGQHVEKKVEQKKIEDKNKESAPKNKGIIMVGDNNLSIIISKA